MALLILSAITPPSAVGANGPGQNSLPLFAGGEKRSSVRRSVRHLYNSRGATPLNVRPLANSARNKAGGLCSGLQLHRSLGICYKARHHDLKKDAQQQGVAARLNLCSSITRLTTPRRDNGRPQEAAHRHSASGHRAAGRMEVGITRTPMKRAPTLRRL